MQNMQEDEEMDLLTALRRMTMGGGQMRAQKNAGLEDKIQAEADALMQEEIAAGTGRPSGWHPPMSMGPMGRAMPNAPRKPVEDQPVMAESRFKASDLGQDPRSMPLPSEEDYAKTAGAMMLPPVVKEPNMTPKDFGNMSFDPSGGLGKPMSANAPGEPETQDEFGQPLDSSFADNAGFDPQSPIDPQAEPEELANMDQPQPDDRQRLRNYLLRQQMAQNPNTGLNEGMRGIGKDNSMLSLVNLFSNAANQAGSIGGKVASNQGIEGFTNTLQGENTRSGNMMMKAQADKQKKKDEQLRGMMFLALQQQNDKKYQGDLEYRKQVLENARKRNENEDWYKRANLEAVQGVNEGKLGLAKKALDFKMNPPEKPLTKLEEADLKLKTSQAKKADAEAQKALKEKDAPPKKADMDIDDSQTIKDLASDNAKRLTRRNALMGVKDQFDNAKTESEKVNYARAILKTLQSMEGPDAINSTDEERLSGYLNHVRLRDALNEGGKVFGTDIPAFSKDIQRRIDSMTSGITETQKSIDRVKSKYGMSPSINITGGQTAGKAPAPGQVKVMWKGKLKLIDASRLDEALAAGAKEIK